MNKHYFLHHLALTPKELALGVTNNGVWCTKSNYQKIINNAFALEAKINCYYHQQRKGFWVLC
jgi:hypothetical protein